MKRLESYRRICGCAAAWVCAISLLPSAPLARAANTVVPKVMSATVDYSKNTIAIVGQNFTSAGPTVVVSLDGITLTQITGTLPIIRFGDLTCRHYASQLSA